VSYLYVYLLACSCRLACCIYAIHNGVQAHCRCLTATGLMCPPLSHPWMRPLTPTCSSRHTGRLNVECACRLAYIMSEDGDYPTMEKGIPDEVKQKQRMMLDHGKRLFETDKDMLLHTLHAGGRLFEEIEDGAILRRPCI
jgi:hypothetical protein